MSIKLDAKYDGEGGVQWDGKHIAVGGYQPPGGTNATPVIYRFAVNGTKGKLVGTTTLDSPARLVLQFYILNGVAIVPNWDYGSITKYDVLLYNYPAGGSPTMELTKHVSVPRGVTVSVAPSR